MVIVDYDPDMTGAGDWYYTPTRTTSLINGMRAARVTCDAIEEFTRMTCTELKNAAGIAEEPAADPVVTHRNAPQAGRNEPCHCGSGKKRKRCCR